MTVTIYEKDARSMLFDLISYNDRIAKEVNWLASKGPLLPDEVKRYQYLKREMTRVTDAAYDLDKEIKQHWGDNKF